jgi:NAD(P)-dependent dehydrogenase (short-subunit alcohol dehydrogenase family)
VTAEGSGALRGLTAVVTGGTSGIGAAVVRRFVAEGAAVVAMARRERAGLADAGASFIECDVSDAVQSERAFAEAHDRLGTLDAIVLNAGISELDADSSTGADLDSFRRQFEVNTMGVVHGVRHAPALMRDGGSITITSTAALAWPFPGYLTYSASKAPLAAVVAHAAMELGPRSIRVNSISPGTIVTDMQPDDDPEARMASIATCLGRFGTPEDVAGAYVFMASDDARYVTATDLRVDGGWIGGLTPVELEALLGDRSNDG